MSVDLTHFEEKSGVICFSTSWGRWWQTVYDIQIEIISKERIRSKDVKINVKSNNIECKIKDLHLFKGQLFGPIRQDEVLWTIEDGTCLSIILSKADHSIKDDMWEALFLDDSEPPDQYTLHEMRKKLDLERFQIENPGLDFSQAKLAKCYDKPPGSSQEMNPRIKEN